ncbi:MAG: dTDP-4-dehydrorhamnose 3,5-epimerase [Crocinitomicaceae bacterium]|nr:dTDP-4-dehydrorhamnose 3,5-epimerase [Crocinitomicaceae bacterium]|tara:strand:+ start:262205 stop:262744 length:540 start_codon:yes stop_codon:yes gene_type:complete
MNTFTPTKIKGVFEIDFFNIRDDRGAFVKTFHAEKLKAQGLETDFKESFYSVNNKNVIRGMHFQTPPDDHAKIVYCTSGSLIDVVVDIRKNSTTYGQFITVELSGNNAKGVYLPTGTAHGFYVKEDNTCMVYLTSTVNSPTNDGGIRYDSFGFDWPTKNGIHSERDILFPTLTDFNTPF